MVKLNVHSIMIPKKFQRNVQRSENMETKRRIEAIISQWTFDAKHAISRQDYTCDVVDKWSIEEVNIQIRLLIYDDRHVKVYKNIMSKTRRDC